MFYTAEFIKAPMLVRNITDRCVYSRFGLF